MVPFAASLLLVLAATSAADDILPRPVRHQRPYNNLTNIDPPSSAPSEHFSYVPVPTGASPPPPTAETGSATESTNSSSDAIADSSYGPTLSSSSEVDVSETFSYKPLDATSSSATGEEPPNTFVYAPNNSSSNGPTAAFSYDPSTASAPPAPPNGSLPQVQPSGSGVLPSPSRPQPGGPNPPPRPTGHIPSGPKPSGQLPPGTAPSFNPPPPYPTNATCGGATLNIASASLDYWYTETYTQVDSTFVIQYNHNDTSTAWTLVPASETLNITSAVEAPSCTSMTAFNTALNSTMLEYSCWDTPTPVAASTTSVEQTAYIPVNQTTSKGSIPNVVVTPTPAALTIGSSSTVAQGTNVVHFSQVEIISKKPLGAYNGTVRCVTTTTVHQLSEPLSFDYEEGADVNAMLVKGKIHAAVLQAVEEDAGVPLSSVSVGTFEAEPTVVVVVQKVLAAAVATPAGIVQSVLSLDTPTPTLPSGLSLVETTPTDTGIIWAPFTAHIESSDTALMVPTKTGPGRGSVVAPTTSRRPLIPVHFTAHIESSDLNLQIPQDPTATNSVVTAVFSGITVTATRVNNPTPGGGNDVGPILSAIISAAQPANTKPTNAAQVLSNAEQTFANPTVGAIASGIGGLTRPGSSSGSGSGSGSGPIVQPGQNPVFSVGTSMVTATNVGGGAFVISGQTASAGGAPITVGGQEVSIAPGGTAIMVGGTTAQLSSPTNPGAVANIPLITVGSQVFTANAATQFNIGGQVLTPGGQVVVQGTTISLAPGATRVAFNGVGSQLSPPAITPAPLLTIGGTVYQPNSGRTYDIGGQILAPGGAIVVSGTTISLPADGSNVVVNGLIQPIGAEGLNGENMATITAPPVLTVDGSMFSANGGTTYIISGETLTPGGGITINGPNGLETISLNDDANQLVTIANSQTATSYVGMLGAASNGAPVLTIDGNTYTAIEYNSGSGATYIIDGQTLTIGGTITLSDQTISLLPGGTAVMIASDGGSTTSQIDGAYGVKPTAAPILTIGGETFTAINNGATYIIDGETLTPDDMETVTIDGHTFVVSLSPHATLLEIVEVGSNGQAITTIYETLFPATATASSRTVTSFVHGAAATTGASPSSAASPTSAEGTNSSNSAPSSTFIPFTGAIVALGSLALAIWL
ncbi:hypothetical protein HII31_07559 [Pseudocercospora fuligena]|uniref:Uncharacterized protein n=1 Tax=Pseudocercospora fuligena TaxID=685502 RepID=A0A8H6RHE9_9PEZI|nr:hypothetical protein HII31_07559 [Pseudocercospora fuligena]